GAEHGRVHVVRKNAIEFEVIKRLRGGLSRLDRANHVVGEILDRTPLIHRTPAAGYLSLVSYLIAYFRNGAECGVNRYPASDCRTSLIVDADVRVGEPKWMVEPGGVEPPTS